MAMARSFVAVLMLVVVATTIAQGVDVATTVITNNLPVEASFVLYNDNDQVSPTSTASAGKTVSWTYDISRAQFCRVAISADELPTRRVEAQLQVWSRSVFPGIADPYTFFKVDDSGLYTQDMPTSAFRFVAPWQVIA